MIIKDYKSARHLSSRLEIGVDDEQSKARVGQHVADVLDSMIPDTTPDFFSEPTFTPWEEVADFNSLPLEIRLDMHRQAKLETRHLTAWWLEQICYTRYPLLDRMTVFWHSHFTSDGTKVAWPQFVLQQHNLFRSHGLGNFSDLLYGIIRDPAMLTYLDVTMNVVGAPNENFARELLELFTLGEGNYTEADIVNTSRAFTGWGINFEAGGFAYSSAQHDEETKEFLGRKANLNGDDIITILLQEPRTAEHIAEKFWAEFINHDSPDPVIIRSWAAEFRDSGYEIKVLLNAVIHSQVFWSEENRGVLIKSPVEFSIGLLRELSLELKDFDVLRKANQQLGQDLFYPPDVKGWRGGNEWITNTWLVRRYDLIPKLMAEHNGDTKSMLEDNVIRPRMRTPKDTKQLRGMLGRLMDSLSCSINSNNLTDWLLAEEPVLAPDCEQSLVNMLYTLLRDPTYQLR